MSRSSLSVESVPLMRYAHPLAFAGFLRAIGAPVESGFRRARLPLLCDDPDAYVPVHCVWSFFDDVVRREGIPALGWQVGRWANQNSFNRALLRRLDASPTLSHALQTFSGIVTTENSHIRLGLHECGDDVLFWVRNAYSSETPGYHVAQAYALELMLSVIRHFAGSDWAPAEIGIQARETPREVQELLSSTRFSARQAFGYIRLPRTLLTAPPAKRWSTGSDAGQRLEDAQVGDLDFVRSLCLMLETYLEEGNLSAASGAALMGTSSRTLRRRLAERGLSYSGLMDRVRFDRAKRMLSESDTKMIDVARATGYTDPSHFARAFRRFAGVSPSEYRAAL